MNEVEAKAIAERELPYPDEPSRENQTFGAYCTADFKWRKACDDIDLQRQGYAKCLMDVKTAELTFTEYDDPACGNCGRIVDPYGGDVFCPKCGSKITTSPASPS